MEYAFIIKPETYSTFENETEQLDKCKEWSLLTAKASKTKDFYYKGNGMNLACEIIGFVDDVTAVIEFENKQKHCIHPTYLKEMQGSKIKVKKEKKAAAQQIELPEEKVKMTATVKEFTTVPNHFSDNDDEVIIYEAVFISDSEMEIGSAWSSHSKTMKKMELEIGDALNFEAKIIKKKLTKHPVPYKINNPSKLQKM